MTFLIEVLWFAFIYWRVSEASETLSGLFNRESQYICMCVCHSTIVTFDL